MTIIAHWDNSSSVTPSTGVVNNGLDYTSNAILFGDVVLAYAPASTAATFMSFPVTMAPGDGSVPVTFTGRMYLQTPVQGWPTNASNLLTFRPTPSTLVFSIAMSGSGAPGQIRVVGIGGTVLANSGNNVIALDSIYLIEYQLYTANGGTSSNVIVRVYNSQDQLLWSTDVSIGSNWSSTITRVDWGKTTGTAVTETSRYAVAGIALQDTADFLGRHPNDSSGPPGGGSTTSEISIYTNGQLQPVECYLYSNGTLSSQPISVEIYRTAPGA